MGNLPMVEAKAAASLRSSSGTWRERESKREGLVYLSTTCSADIIPISTS